MNTLSTRNSRGGKKCAIEYKMISMEIDDTRQECIGAESSFEQVDINKRRSKLMEEWKNTCIKWGFVVVRQQLFEHFACNELDENNANSARNADLVNANTNSRPEYQDVDLTSTSSSKTVYPVVKLVDRTFKQISDRLVVSQIIPGSVSDKAGLKVGDVIHTVYGIKNPTLSLLFGIMRDSNRFMFKIEREVETSTIDKKPRQRRLDIGGSATLDNSCATQEKKDLTDGLDASLSEINAHELSHIRDADNRSRHIPPNDSQENDDVSMGSPAQSPQNLVEEAVIDNSSQKEYTISSKSASNQGDGKNQTETRTMNPIEKNVSMESSSNHKKIASTKENTKVKRVETSKKNEQSRPHEAKRDKKDCPKNSENTEPRQGHHPNESLAMKPEPNDNIELKDKNVDYGDEEEMFLNTIRESIEKNDNEVAGNSIARGKRKNNDKDDSSFEKKEKKKKQKKNTTIRHDTSSFVEGTCIDAEGNAESANDQEIQLHTISTNQRKISDRIEIDEDMLSPDIPDLQEKERKKAKWMARDIGIIGTSRKWSISSNDCGRKNSISSFEDKIDENANDATNTSSKSKRRDRSILASSIGTSTSKTPGEKLKRLYPDSSGFGKNILKWKPPNLVVEGSTVRFQDCVELSSKEDLPTIPLSFQSTSDLRNNTVPHILDEGIHSIRQEFRANSDRNGFWTRDVFKMTLRHCIQVDRISIQPDNCPSLRTYEFAFQVDTASSKQLQRNLGELFAIHSPHWEHKTCLGMIGSSPISTNFLSDQMIDDNDNFDLFKLWICVSDEDVPGSGWLPKSDMPSQFSIGSTVQTYYVLNVGTCIDMMRQYEAVKSLSHIKPNLLRALLTYNEGEEPKKGKIIEELPKVEVPKPRSLTNEIWDHLKKTTNKYQLAAIRMIMSGKAKENIALLQGPPGTGKTSTIVALVSALLNGNAPVHGKQAAGTKIHVGQSLRSSKSETITHDTNVTKRILVCAPSNQAVDELAYKIHLQSIGSNGKSGSFNITRFGICPGEDRHDGRGKRSKHSSKTLHSSARDQYLISINMDVNVSEVATGKDTHDFRHSGDFHQSKKRSSSRNSRHINFGEERQKILSKCHVVCTTLSGAGSKAFIDAVARDEFPDSEFDAIIIDEACQGSEVSTLIPFKFNPNLVVLVGDPKQLPVMKFSQDSSRCRADRSLFDRLYENGWPINMLRIQYRMHESIVSFPSKTFYKNNLITAKEVLTRKPAPWHSHHMFPPYLLFDVDNGVMNRSREGGISNNAEANFVVKILERFSQEFRELKNLSFGIITFYNDQVTKIKKIMNRNYIINWMKYNNISIQVSTVDGFQGSEKDIIILSCVRSKYDSNTTKNNKSVGFLNDFRRVNVALTRAKYSLWAVAHYEMLNKDPLWSSLIHDAYERNLICHSSDLDRHTSGRPIKPEHQYGQNSKHKRRKRKQKKKKSQGKSSGSKPKKEE